MTEANIVKINNDLSFANGAVAISDDFANILKEINHTVAQTSNLVSIKSIKDTDEKSIDTAISDLEKAQKLTKVVETARKDLKRYLKARNDKILEQFDEILGDNYKELVNLDNQAKNLKRELRALRLEERFDEVKTIFEANLQKYPLVMHYAPSLTDFNQIRLRYPNLVSAGKTFKITDKIIGIIDQYFYEINTSLEDLVANNANFTPDEQNAILKQYLLNPTAESYFKLKNDLLQAKLEQAQNKEASPKQAQAKDKIKNQGLNLPKLASDFLFKFVTTNYQYHNFSKDNHIKVILIKELTKQADSKASDFGKFINSFDEDTQDLIFLMVTNLVIRG